MTTFGTLTWREQAGEGHFWLSPSFYASDRVTQLDALVDWIASLQKEYERVLNTSDAKDKR